MNKKILFSLSVLIVLLAAAFFVSCGDGGTSTGSVAFYVTDSPEDDYEWIRINVNDVQLVHTGTGSSCDILEGTINDLDIKELSSALRFVQSSKCESKNYNRIHVEFEDQVILKEDMEGVVKFECNLTSYKDKNNNPKTLQCNGDTCSIDINGAVNVLANQNNKLALDFELKDFEIDRLIDPCTVTIKVSPLHASGIKEKLDDGYNEGISGYITALTDESFKITSGGDEFTVRYDNIGGVYNALLLTQSDTLVEVEASSIDLDGNNITASAIYVELEGIVSGLINTDTDKIFILTYDDGKTITVDYSNAEVKGTLGNDIIVEVKLNGYDDVNSNYLTKEVEIED